MIRSPILKVLSSIRWNHVQSLLMGGQACVLYGGAEFSRDTDLAILASPGNLGKLSAALQELEAECITVPPLELEFLQRGHAIHFRCRHPEAQGMRVDVMSVLRGLDPFEELWERRNVLDVRGFGCLELLSLPDLVLAKKTQRDKDWPMIRRLLEADYFARRMEPRPDRVNFWLRELRTPELLIELAQSETEACRQLASQRPCLKLAREGNQSALREALMIEEWQERERDRLYWLPLKRELELLRRSKSNPIDDE